MSSEFNPARYKTYNPETGKAEQQFKELEDLPDEYMSQFKKVPGGGFVRRDAVEDFEAAWYMAAAENSVYDRELPKLEKLREEIERLEAEAEKAEELAAQAYDARAAARASSPRSDTPNETNVHSPTRAGG